MNVLIAIKKELDAKLILDYISNYRWPSTAKFRVVHVLSGAECNTDKKRDCLAKFLGDFLDKARKQTGVQDVQSVVDQGEPIGSVLRVSDYVEADIVIMGHDPSHTEDHISVSESLAQLEKCSVIIIRPPVEHSEKEVVSATTKKGANV